MVTLSWWRSNRSSKRQMPTRSPYSRSVTAAMFLLNTALAGGTRWLERCSDSRVAKLSGQISHGTMKVTQIFALFGHSIGFGRPTAVLPARKKYEKFIAAIDRAGKSAIVIGISAAWRLK